MSNEKDRCFWCDATLDRQWLQRDHVVPQCLGGPDELWNLVLACSYCNQSKGREWPSVFVARRLAKNIELFRGYKGFSRSYCSSMGWVWNERENWAEFVDDRLMFSIAAEGRFTVWASETKNERALAAIGSQRSQHRLLTQIMPSKDLIGEIERLQARNGYLHSRIIELERELADVNEKLILAHVGATQLAVAS